MYIAWKRILLAAGVIASAGLATPALAKHSDHSIRDGRETQVRHHARHAAGRHAHAGRRFVRFEHRRFASARRPHRIASGESAGVDQTYTGFVQGARWFTCHFFGHVAPETIGARPSDEIRLMRGDALVHSLQVLPGLPSQRGSQCMIANSIERIVNARPGWRTVAELAPAYPSLAARASRSPA